MASGSNSSNSDAGSTSVWCGNEKFDSLPAAGKHYIGMFFPDWLVNPTFTIVPHMPWINDPVLYRDDCEKMVKGYDAELLVYKSISQWGTETKQPMFVIKHLLYTPDNAGKTANLLAESGISSSLKDAKSVLPLEIDFLMIHAKIGVIIAEVKAAEQPSTRKDKVSKQLKKAADFIRLFCPLNYPVHKLGIFPNADIEIQREDSVVFCGKSFCEDPWSVFGQLVGRTVPANETNDVIFWAIALKCFIVSINNQKPLQLEDIEVDRAKQAKETDRRLVQQDVFLGKDQGQFKMVCARGAVVFLTPQQISVWGGPKQQFIKGVAGTGKTVLVQFGVLKLVPKGEPVVVLATNAVSRVYESIFKKDDKVTVFDENKLEEGFQSFETTAMSSHLFIDEYQALRDGRIADVIKRKRLSEDGKYLWVCFDSAQSPKQLTVPDVKRIEGNLGLQRAVNLSYVMRCTPEITSYWEDNHIRNCDVEEVKQGNRLHSCKVEDVSASDHQDAVDIVERRLDEMMSVYQVLGSEFAVFVHSLVSEKDALKMALESRLGTRGPIAIETLPGDIYSLEWMFVFVIAGRRYLHPSRKSLEGKTNENDIWNREIYLASSRCKVQLFLISID